MISILHYLYRKLRVHAIAVVAVLVLSTVGTAQLRDRTEHKRADEDQSQTQSKKLAKRGPRAIGVIEFLPKGGARLVPIALWIDGHYYDASFYSANPAPMALQPETLYEAMNYGEPTGWFTVTTPKQINGTWVADGSWKPETPFDVMQAHQAAKQPKKKPRSPTDDDSGPPVLRRAPSSGSADSTADSSSKGTVSSSSGNAQAPTSADSDRPTLKDSSPLSSGSSSSSDGSRPTLGPDTSPSDSKPATAPAPTLADDNDPDRPTLKNSSPPSSGSSSSTTASQPALGGNTSQSNPQAASTPAPPTSTPDENDPDRPTLYRGKPSAQPSTSATAASTAAVKPKPVVSHATATTAATSSPKASAAASQPQSSKAYPAISDAGTYDIRSLFYAMTPADREERGKPMLALALDEVRNYTSKRQQGNTAAKTAAKAPAKTPAQASNFVVTDYDLLAFDLDFSNSPTFVLTAKAAAPVKAGETVLDYFVTVVARVDINGVVQKVFTSVTDNNHLDAFPRLEIIDAVDADANGRGELLFRQHSDTGVSYALYRVYPYQMVKVFEGGSNM